jgi:hypothetical protein
VVSKVLEEYITFILRVDVHLLDVVDFNSEAEDEMLVTT